MSPRWALCLVGAAVAAAGCESLNPIEGFAKLFPPSLAERVIDVGSDNADTRREAVQAIGEHDKVDDIPAIRELMVLVARTDRSPLVRAAACQALANIKHLEAREALVGRLAEDPDPYVRADAATALGVQGDPASIEPLATAMREDKDVDVRIAAADALSGIRERAAATALVGGLNARDVGVAHTAWESLRYMTGQDLPREPGPWTDFLVSADEPLDRYGKPPALPEGENQRPRMRRGVREFLANIVEEDPVEAELK